MEGKKPASRPERQSEPPPYRREFPVDQAEDREFSRREFGKFLVLVSGSMVCGQAWLAGRVLTASGNRPPSPEKAIARLDALPVGGAITFRYPEPDGEPGILVRLSQDSLAAYVQRCTHLSCAVVWDAGRGAIHCPCHNGFFDPRDGRPTAGPPRRPLTAIRLEMRDGWIYALGKEEPA